MSGRGRPPSWGHIGAVVLLALTACHRSAPVDVEVEVRNVGFDQAVGAPVVILQARDGGQLLPIWIGQTEAQAIAMEMQKITPPRPMTHDLMKQILERTGVRLRRVRITELQQQTFLARLILEKAGEEMEIDCRPSDAIALALRFASPILLNPALLEGALGSSGGVSDATANLWGLTLQELTPVLADSLGLEAREGVLVSDVGERQHPAGAVKRGDVIVAVDGERVRTLAELRHLAREQRGAHEVELKRGAERVTVTLHAPGG